MKIPTRDELEALTQEELRELRARIARLLEESLNACERDTALRALDDIAVLLLRPRVAKRPLPSPAP